MMNPDPHAPPPYHSNAYAPPTAPMQSSMPSPQPRAEATLGQRIAGALLIVNALLVILELLVMPHDPKDPLGKPGSSIVPIAIDVGIGIALVSNSPRMVPVAIIRAVLGMVLFAIVRVTQGEFFMAAMHLAVSASLLILLVGDAKGPRLAFGSALFGLYGLLSLVGIGSMVTGKNPLAAMMQTASGQIESKPAGVVTGRAQAYRITTPSVKWHLRTDAAAKKDNPLADRWLTRPDVDAHVLVIAEKIPGGMIGADALTDVVIENAQKVSTDFKLLDRKPLRTHPEDGRMLHTQSVVNGLPIESIVGVVGYYEHGFQVVAFAPRTSFSSVEAELRSIVESFQKPAGELPGAPSDCEPTLVTRVEGVAQAYVLTPAGEGWYVRKDEAAKKDNELADRWIVRPDKQGHILVVAELAPGAVVDPDKYAEAIEENIKKNLSGVILSRTKSTSQPKIGRILRAKATVEGQNFEYLYGLFADGPRAFQVIAFSQAQLFGKLEEEFRKTIEAFELPKVAK